jgi:archaellum component FlaF (FlaF/FlaG flagellin family)
MGFGTIFATVAMVIILGVSSYLFVTGALFSMDTMSNSLQEINEIDNERLKTEIDLGSISVTSSNPGPKSDITVHINNTGSTKIVNSNFKHMDVFIHYYPTGLGDQAIHRRLPYNASAAFSADSDALGNNEWTVVRITPDLINPRVFDPDEDMEIQIRVYPAIGNSSPKQNWTKIVMPNAISDATYF